MNNSVKVTGYSQRINDTAVKAFLKKNTRATQIFIAVIAVIALVAIIIFARDDLEIALLTWAIVLAFTLLLSFKGGRKNKKAWDGRLEEKRIIQKVYNEEGVHSQVTNTPTLFFRTTSGKTEKVELTEGAEGDKVFNYYEIGDRVRKHSNFGYPEKHEKTETIICVFCGKLLSIEDEKCTRCGMIAIK